jgi:hypothetical protein
MPIGCCPVGCIMPCGADMPAGAFELPKPGESLGALIPAEPAGLFGTT